MTRFGEGCELKWRMRGEITALPCSGRGGREGMEALGGRDWEVRWYKRCGQRLAKSGRGVRIGGRGTGG